MPAASARRLRTSSEEIDLMFGPVSNLSEFITSGNVKAIAVGSVRPLEAHPDVPTLLSVFPKFVTGAWYAMVAPPKTPRPIADKLSSAVNEILAQQAIVRRLKDLSLMPEGGSPDQTQAILKEEAERWRTVIAKAGIKAQ